MSFYIFPFLNNLAYSLLMACPVFTRLTYRCKALFCSYLLIYTVWNYNLDCESKKGCKDQESIQSSENFKAMNVF